MCMDSVSSSRSNVRGCGKHWTSLDITLSGTALGSCVSSEMCKPKRMSTMVVYTESRQHGKDEAFVKAG